MPCALEYYDKRFVDDYIHELQGALDVMHSPEFARALAILYSTLHNCGKLTIVGLGGSAANASHAYNDFRKIAGMDAYAPLDNVAEWSAWVNDDGWEDSLSKMMPLPGPEDTLLVLSVGGGSEETSLPLVRAAQFTRDSGGSVISIVSRDGGMVAKLSHAAVIIPVEEKRLITPVAEAMQAVVWHAWANMLGMEYE